MVSGYEIIHIAQPPLGEVRWFSVAGSCLFTKKVLSWQRELSPLEPRLRLAA